MSSKNIAFNDIPYLRRPQIAIEFNTSLAVRSLPNNHQRMLIIGQRMGALIEPRIFQGGTLNDMTTGGAFTGTAVKKFKIKITTAAATDKFDWSADDGATWTTAVSITGSAQTLSLGVTVTFGAITGHALNDEWRFNAYPAPLVAELVPTQTYSDSESAANNGQGSMAHLMVKAAIRANPYLDLTVITLSDAAGVAASGTVTITGPATGVGVVTLYIANEKIEVAIASTDSASAIAAALCNAIAAKPGLPVTASNTAGVVTLSAKNKGLCGNNIGLGYLNSAPGVTVAIVAMASGATDPDVQDALDVILPEDYTIIITPFNNQTALTTLRDHLDLVSGPREQRPATAYYATNGILSAATTLAGLVNHGRILGAYLRYSSATLRKSMPYEVAAAYAAIKAYVEDPAMPLNFLEVKGIAVPEITDRLTNDEQEVSCLYNGVAPIKVGPGEKLQIVRSISTYIKNDMGIDDISLLDIQTICTMDYTRKAMLTRFSQRFGRTKKTQRVKNQLRSEAIDVALMLQDLEILENIKEWKEYFIVEDDLVDPNRLNIRIPTPVVPGLHVIAGRMDLIIGYTPGDMSAAM